jgi:hypothetical protein
MHPAMPIVYPRRTGLFVQMVCSRWTRRLLRYRLAGVGANSGVSSGKHATLGCSWGSCVRIRILSYISLRSASSRTRSRATAMARA